MSRACFPLHRPPGRTRPVRGSFGSLSSVSLLLWRTRSLAIYTRVCVFSRASTALGVAFLSAAYANPSAQVTHVRDARTSTYGFSVGCISPMPPRAASTHTRATGVVGKEECGWLHPMVPDCNSHTHVLTPAAAAALRCAARSVSLSSLPLPRFTDRCHFPISCDGSLPLARSRESRRAGRILDGVPAVTPRAPRPAVLSRRAHMSFSGRFHPRRAHMISRACVRARGWTTRALCLLSRAQECEGQNRGGNPGGVDA